MKKILSFILLISFISMCGNAQNRIYKKNTLGWYSVFTTLKFNDKWSGHAEFQYRRVELLSKPQQNLLRVGINFQPNKKLLFRIGYANVETFSYGDIPLNSMGKDFSENRIFEMVTLNDNLNRIELSHRFMLEQRFVGKYSKPELDKEDQVNFVNRARYMFRMQIPLQTKVTVKNSPYLAIYDELLIGFGKNVGENIFDQNRIGVLLGYKFNNTFKIEAGYLNQLLQLGREVENKNVFQNNSGLLISTMFNFNMKKSD
jgi:hypothetical protein